MNLFTQLYKSLYSPKTIAMFRFQKIGKTILFIFLLALISFLPNAIFLTKGINEGLKVFEKSIESLPYFTIENGQLTSNTEGPIERKQGEYIIILDHQDELTKAEVEVYHNAIALLKKEMIFVFDGTAQAIDYTLFEGSMTKDDFLQFIEQLNALKLIILSVLLFLLYFAASFAKYLEITVLALIAILFKKKLNKKLNFKQLFTLSAYSVALSTIFFTIMNSLQTNVPFEFYLSWFIHLMMMYLTLKEIPSPIIKKKEDNF